MFKQIDQANYPIIKTFVNQFQYRVAVNTVLDLNTKGFVFADDTDKPTIALVWDTLSQIFIFGKINSIDEFNQAFKQVVDEIISPKLIKDGEAGASVSFFEEKYWDSLTDKVIEDNYLHRNNDWLGIFDKNSYLKLKELQKPLFEGYELLNISKEILMADENTALKEMILDRWQEIDDYLEKGIGFCILKNLKVVSCCFSGFVSDYCHYEISVKTFDDNERKKGLATHCTIAYIDHCLEKNYQPHWETDHTNVASHNLANKVGFIDFTIENNFIFLFDRANHYLWRIHYNLFNKEIDLDFIEFAIKKAFEDSNQKPNPRYIYAVANKLAENGIPNHVIFLLNEYLKVDKSTLQSVIDNANFKPLHDTQEWKELLKKYEE